MIRTILPPQGSGAVAAKLCALSSRPSFTSRTLTGTTAGPSGIAGSKEVDHMPSLFSTSRQAVNRPRGAECDLHRPTHQHSPPRRGRCCCHQHHRRRHDRPSPSPPILSARRQTMRRRKATKTSPHRCSRSRRENTTTATTTTTKVREDGAEWSRRRRRRGKGGQQQGAEERARSSRCGRSSARGAP